jgi:putative serine protease PepD
MEPAEPMEPAESAAWWARPAEPVSPAAAAEPAPDDANQPSASPSSGYSQPSYGLPPSPGSTYGQSSYGQPSYGAASSEPPPQPSSWQSSYGQPVIAGATSTNRDRRSRGLPSLLLVALVAALVGAGVGSGVVAATRDSNTKTSPNDAVNPDGNAAPTVVASLPAGSSAQVAQSLLPSVVSIIVTGSNQQDEGTGIILSSDGQIVTNNHVVEAAAGGGVIAVTFSDGSTAKAAIVGRDPTSDLAVIKANNVNNLHPATLAQNPTIVVGEEVVAVGSPLGLSNTVTSGIVSSLNRPVCTQNCNGSSNGSTPTVLDAIQTDAAINPGNSGGPLVDMSGRVIGINTAIATLDQQQAGQSGNIGVGFAIPINEARRVISELQQSGHASHAVIGIGVNDSIDSTLHTPNGAKIVSVTPGGPADKAGIKAGDILVKFGDRTVVDADSLIAATHAAVPNSTVTVTYTRGDQRQTASVQLGSATSS